jgi:hypothetical protein
MQCDHHTLKVTLVISIATPTPPKKKYNEDSSLLRYDSMLQGNYLKIDKASSQKILIFLNIAVRTSTLGKSARFFNKQN